MHPIGDRASFPQTSSSKAPELFGQPEKKQRAEQAAKALIDAFVDRRVATGFVDKLIDVLADYPAEIVERLVDPKRGLPRQFARMPSLKEIADAAEKLAAQDHDRQRYRDMPAKPLRYSTIEAPPREPFRPFPKLWEAFAADREVMAALDSHLPFPQVEAASRALARSGPTEARAVLVGEAR